MQVGPTCHYVMGGIEVDPDTAALQGAGAVRRRGVFRRHARVEPPRRQLAVRLLVFGLRAGLGAVEYLNGLGASVPTVAEADVTAARDRADVALPQRGRGEPGTRCTSSCSRR